MSSHPLELLATHRDLGADEQRRLEVHLATCAECRDTLAAYQRQDAALLAVPRLQPSRSLAAGWRGRAPAASRFSALSSLSGAFTLAGLAALIWFAILQFQAPRAVAAEPGTTLPATSIRLPSPWLPALPWLAASLLLVGVLLVLSRRSVRAPVAAGALCAILLVSFIPPLSALPNPAALVWRFTGGYSYDPRLPFKNNFLIAGRPNRQLQPYLDQLIGQVGLSPLDPSQPLVRYEILRVGLHPQQNRVALVTTRFIYADGTSRIYPVPLLGPTVEWSGFLLSDWRADGLERLRSQHLALSEQPFATADSPIRLGPARRLELSPEASRLDEADPAHWLWDSVRLQRLAWAPDGSAFVCIIESDASRRQLWLVPIDGSAPTPIGQAGDIREYGFSPNGRVVVYTQTDPDAQAADPTTPFAILAVEPGERSTPRTIATALASDRMPGLSPLGVWFFTADGQMWVAPWDGGPPRSAGEAVRPPMPPRPAPDDSMVAYGCRSDLCLQSVATGHVIQVDGLWPADATWAPDGSTLAVVTRDINNLRPVELHLFDREGSASLRREIAPRDVTDPPQWTPDGQAVFVQTYPQDGRRIIALDVASGQVLDLSQEHWDAYFSLSPDGRTLLLNNGRGDFWMADVLR